jgi:hypothetical protein
LQAGGRRFESDHLHRILGLDPRNWCGVDRVVSRRRERKPALMVLHGTAMPLVSPVGGVVLCQGESGSGASLGVPARMSDRMCCPFDGVASSEQVARSDDDCCVLSESDPSCAESFSVVGDGWR